MKMEHRINDPFINSPILLGIHYDDNRFAFIQLKTFHIPLSYGQKRNVTSSPEAACHNPTTLMIFLSAGNRGEKRRRTA